MANKKDPRAVAEKGIADAVKSHKDGNGLVRIYPVLTKRTVAGQEQVTIEHTARYHDGRGVPAVQQDVEPAMAEYLLGFYPPAFTLYESGNPMKEQDAIHEANFAQAWGEDPATSADPVDAAVTINAPAGEQEKEV